LGRFRANSLRCRLRGEGCRLGRRARGALARPGPGRTGRRRASQLLPLRHRAAPRPRSRPRDRCRTREHSSVMATATEPRTREAGVAPLRVGRGAGLRVGLGCKRNCVAARATYMRPGAAMGRKRRRDARRARLAPAPAPTAPRRPPPRRRPRQSCPPPRPRQPATRGCRPPPRPPPPARRRRPGGASTPRARAAWSSSCTASGRRSRACTRRCTRCARRATRWAAGGRGARVGGARQPTAPRVARWFWARRPPAAPPPARPPPDRGSLHL
jgi:hypothetical protein